MKMNYKDSQNGRERKKEEREDKGDREGQEREKY